MRFYYTAVNVSGKEISGVLDAENRDQAIDLIKGKDLFATYVNVLEDETMRPIPTPPKRPSLKIEKEGGENSSFESALFLIITSLIFFVVMFFAVTLDNIYRSWQIEKLVKKMVQQECLTEGYRSK